MEHFNAGTLNGEPVPSCARSTARSSATRRSTASGSRSRRKRSSYGKDTLDQLFYRRLSTGQVRRPKSFFKAAAQTPQTFNSFYIDNKHVADVHERPAADAAQGVDPRPADDRHRQVRVAGFLSDASTPRASIPATGRSTNWNNGSAHGFGAADDDWGRNGSRRASTCSTTTSSG